MPTLRFEDNAKAERRHQEILQCFGHVWKGCMEFERKKEERSSKGRFLVLSPEAHNICWGIFDFN